MEITKDSIKKISRVHNFFIENNRGRTTHVLRVELFLNNEGEIDYDVQLKHEGKVILESNYEQRYKGPLTGSLIESE
jgi:hypothetical protein